LRVGLRTRDETARGLRLPHNTARKYGITELLTELARAEAALLGRPVDHEDLPHLRERLWQEETVRKALDSLWPDLTPEELIGTLWSDPKTLARVGAAAGLRSEEHTSELQSR